MYYNIVKKLIEERIERLDLIAAPIILDQFRNDTMFFSSMPEGLSEAIKENKESDNQLLEYFDEIPF